MKKSSSDSGVPDMSDYEILKHQDVRGYCLLKIRYKNCTNHGGEKLLLYPWNYTTLIDFGCTFDPHFNDELYAYSERMSPCARFEPTSYMWDRAIDFAEIL